MNARTMISIDRKLPMLGIIMVGLQTFTFVAFAASWTSSINARIVAIEKTNDRDQDIYRRVADMGATVTELGHRTKRIEDKIDRLNN